MISYLFPNCLYNHNRAWRFRTEQFYLLVHTQELVRIYFADAFLYTGLYPDPSMYQLKPMMSKCHYSIPAFEIQFEPIYPLVNTPVLERIYVAIAVV